MQEATCNIDVYVDVIQLIPPQCPPSLPIQTCGPKYANDAFLFTHTDRSRVSIASNHICNYNSVCPHDKNETAEKGQSITM